MRQIYIYVTGIMTFPGASNNWVGRAVTFTHLNSEARAEKIEYLSFPALSRLLGQKNRMKKLARTLTFYQDWDIHLVGHSNGCAVILDALRYLNWPRIESIHFFSPACKANCRKNGIRDHQYSQTLKRFIVFLGGRDIPVRIAGSYIGELFGYGTMGTKGPIGFDPSLTEVRKMSEWGHSEWWEDTNFPWTMQQVLGDSLIRCN